MPLPPLLLERLKRRKIIRDAPLPKNQEPSQPQPSIDSLESKYQHSQNEVVTTGEQEELEEIIAEDYSDDENLQEEDKKETYCDKIDDQVATTIKDKSQENLVASQDSSTGAEIDETCDAHDELIDSVIGCPNKYNIYHNCSKYCIDRYSKPENNQPTMQQRKDLALILKMYPMSNEWTVVYDPGVSTFYFWNIISNLVSWLPPGMNGFVSVSADQIRRSIKDVDQL